LARSVVASTEPSVIAAASPPATVRLVPAVTLPSWASPPAWMSIAPAVLVSSAGP
jgi:hypothetical protein